MSSAKRNILVIKHGALGDIVQGFDAYASLRAGHKGDHLTVLTTPAFAGFFAAMPYFDEVLVDRRAHVLNIIEALRIRKILRRDWDMVYDLQTSGRSTFYCAYIIKRGGDINVISNARRSGAYRLPDMRHLNNRDRMLAIAAKGGCKAQEADLAWLKAGGAAADKNAMVLVPGCSPGRPQKRWPPEHFSALAGMLAEADKGGGKILMVGTDSDRAAGAAVLAGFPALDDRMGQTDLPQLARLLGNARLVIGNDTGPVFLAARLGAPTLMLMSGHTDSVASAPHGPRTAWLREENIADISPGAAFAAARKLLA